MAEEEKSTEETILMIEHVINLSSSLSDVVNHLRLLTERGILEWGSNYNGTAIMGQARGSDLCHPIITTSYKLVKGKGLVGEVCQLDVIGFGPFNSFTFVMDAKSRNPLTEFRRFVLSRLNLSVE